MPDMGLWEGYKKLYNLIKYEELKGNINIEAIVSKHNLFLVQDGYEVISPKDIVNREFGYIIVTSSKYYGEILADAENIAGEYKEKGDKWSSTAYSRIRF